MATKTSLGIAGIIATVLVVAGLIFILKEDSEPAGNGPNIQQPTSNSQNSSNPTTASNANYIDYSEESLAQSEADTNLLFFHAPWCTICTSIERNIKAAELPDNVTIHKVDYDNSPELIDKYKINYQSAFVQVDEDGNLLKSWQGKFGDSVQEILSNTVSTDS